MPVNATLADSESESWGGDEVFHNSTLDINSAFPVTTALCGEIYRNYHEVRRFPATFQQHLRACFRSSAIRRRTPSTLAKT